MTRKSALPPEPPAREDILIGREVVALSDQCLIDISVELAMRRAEDTESNLPSEPSDKLLIALRTDHRDARARPTRVVLESGATRQLAATRIKAADRADELDNAR